MAFSSLKSLASEAAFEASLDLLPIGNGSEQVEGTLMDQHDLAVRGSANRGLDDVVGVLVAEQRQQGLLADGEELLDDAVLKLGSDQAEALLDDGARVLMAADCVELTGPSVQHDGRVLHLVSFSHHVLDDVVTKRVLGVTVEVAADIREELLLLCLGDVVQDALGGDAALLSADNRSRVGHEQVEQRHGSHLASVLQEELDHAAAVEVLGAQGQGKVVVDQSEANDVARLVLGHGREQSLDDIASVLVAEQASEVLGAQQLWHEDGTGVRGELLQGVLDEGGAMRSHRHGGGLSLALLDGVDINTLHEAILAAVYGVVLAGVVVNDLLN